MSHDEILNKLKEIKIENYIWIIYIGIIFMSWYSNSLEKDYFINKNINSKTKYRNIMLIIFSILLIVYLYFLYDAYTSLRNLKPNANKKERDLATLSFIASLLITISGAIFLYITYNDNDLNIELAFN